jgi:hypothetical protein
VGSNLDPLALVVAAKQRHYAYKPLGSGGSTPILGADYTPSYQQGVDPARNPAADASLRARGMQANPAAAMAARYKPSSPLNPVEPTANGIPLPNFADGGNVTLHPKQSLADAFARQAAVPSAGADPNAQAAYLAQARTRVGDSLASNLRARAIMESAPASDDGIAKATDTLKRVLASSSAHPNDLASQLRTSLVDPSRLDALAGKDPSLDTLIHGYKIAVSNSDVPDDLRSALANKLENIGQTPQQVAAQAQPQAATQVPPQTASQPMAEGGSASDSSLKWLADTARKLGISSMAPDRARVATGIAKQFYGLDENGQPKLGGEAWTSGQKGTPPRILDELTSIPGGVVSLINAVNGKGPAGTSQMKPPSWSTDAAARLDQLDQKVKQTTGVGDAQTVPEHIEDAGAMLATPLPATKVAEEAPMLQRALEYLTPVRPPTLARYATDSVGLGGASAGLDAIAQRLAAKKAVQRQPTQPDSQIEDTAIADTNQGYAGGGSSRREFLQKLAGLGAALSAGPVIKSVLKDSPDIVKSETAQVAPKTGAAQMTEPMGKRYLPIDLKAGDLADHLEDVYGLNPQEVPQVKALASQPMGDGLHRVTISAPQSLLDEMHDFHVQNFGGPVGHSTNTPNWAVHPDELGQNAHPIHETLNDIKQETFGPSDEPDWEVIEHLLPQVPGHEKVMPHYQAMKDEFQNFKDMPEGTPYDLDPGEQDRLDDKVNRFHQALDDLSAEHGVPIAPDPNVE